MFVMPGDRSEHHGTERTAFHVRSWKTGHTVPTSRSVDHHLRQLLCSRRQRTHNSLSEGCLKRMREMEPLTPALQYSKQTDAPHADMGCPLSFTLFLYAFEITVETTLCHQFCTYVRSLFYLTSNCHFLSARVY